MLTQLLSNLKGKSKNSAVEEVTKERSYNLMMCNRFHGKQKQFFKWKIHYSSLDEMKYNLGKNVETISRSVIRY